MYDIWTMHNERFVLGFSGIYIRLSNIFTRSVMLVSYDVFSLLNEKCVAHMFELPHTQSLTQPYQKHSSHIGKSNRHRIFHSCIHLIAFTHVKKCGWQCLISINMYNRLHSCQSCVCLFVWPSIVHYLHAFYSTMVLFLLLLGSLLFWYKAFAGFLVAWRTMRNDITHDTWGVHFDSDSNHFECASVYVFRICGFLCECRATISVENRSRLKSNYIDLCACLWFWTLPQ